MGTIVSLCIGSGSWQWLLQIEYLSAEKQDLTITPSRPSASEQELQEAVHKYFTGEDYEPVSTHLKT